MDLEFMQFVWLVLSVPIGILYRYFHNLNEDHRKSRAKIWTKIEEEVKLRIAIEQKLAIIEDRESNKHG